jgi:hypothetical protein
LYEAKRASAANLKTTLPLMERMFALGMVHVAKDSQTEPLDRDLTFWRLTPAGKHWCGEAAMLPEPEAVEVVPADDTARALLGVRSVLKRLKHVLTPEEVAGLRFATRGLEASRK